jgi:N-acetylmuramoyl-L-alanine amidase
MTHRLTPPLSWSRRRLLQQSLGGAVVLWLGPQQLAWGAELVAVRVWPAQDYTRVTLESDSALNANFFAIAHPNRLVIDIEGLALSPQIKELVSKVRSDDPFIASVRVGQNKPNVVRLVLDLKQHTKPQVFGLAPVAAYQHRLVFDLYPTPDSPATSPTLSDASATPSSAAPAKPTVGTSPGAYMSAPGPATAVTPEVSGSQQAAAAMNDALDEFIGSLQNKPQDKVVAKAAPRPAPADKTIERKVVTGDAQASAQRLVIVALDAGHGGEDPGASWPQRLCTKKTWCWPWRRNCDSQASMPMPGMRAMLTRDSDYFVPLHERVNKARRVQADLFVSIHADAFTNPQGAWCFGVRAVRTRWHRALRRAGWPRSENASRPGGWREHQGQGCRRDEGTLLDMSTTAQIKDSLKLGNGRVGPLWARWAACTNLVWSKPDLRY